MPLVDPLSKEVSPLPRSVTGKDRDDLTLEHTMGYTGDKSLPNLVVRFNRALRDKHLMRPGLGRWVEYILPDLRRAYVEANLNKMVLGRLPNRQITARVVIKPGATEYTNDLHNLMMMRMVEVSGDLLDVVRTAGKVGLYVSDPGSRSGSVHRGTEVSREKVSALDFVKSAIDPITIGVGLPIAAAGLTAGLGAKVLHRRRKERKDPLHALKRDFRLARGDRGIGMLHDLYQHERNRQHQARMLHTYAPGEVAPV